MRLSLLRVFGVSALFVFLLAPLSTYAAALLLAPSLGTHHKGENFDVNILIDSANTSVNAFSGVILFPTNTLEIVSINKSNSIVNLWTQNPSFSNAGNFGNIRFEGVVLNPGFIGSKGKILTLTFRVKNEGSANLTFTEYAVLENNGLGTNVAATAQGANFTFLPQKSDTQENGVSTGVQTVVAVKEVYIPGDKITGIWNFLPGWIKISILSLVGLTTILLSLLIISFGVVILIWLWGHLRERANEMSRWLEVLRSLIKNFFMAIPVIFGLAEKEVQGDIKYSVNQMQENIREAKSHTPLSQVLYDFWTSIKRIVRRFFTKDEKTVEETNINRWDETVENDRDTII